jgi:hypothetical protein
VKWLVWQADTWSGSSIEREREGGGGGGISAIVCNAGVFLRPALWFTYWTYKFIKYKDLNYNVWTYEFNTYNIKTYKT